MAHRDIQGVHREYSGGLRGILSVVADLSEVHGGHDSLHLPLNVVPCWIRHFMRPRIFKGTQRGITMLRTSPMLILSLFVFPSVPSNLHPKGPRAQIIAF